ncbi:gamma-aminobutyric acid receptor subunit beta-like [Argiope bruennichi]|uniref:Glycine receptor subunit alpha-3 like protein n=1 Tax=Argiope bruennichi TaxID=94029 RepID=A0A8T0EDI4_ARGBR|nr:gamma-aminobutyric acid receptor subunit beta-like [Argiope bruennichi]KAF8770710.1 Glycine receptor subunit alpha-3 like protein [Argiope bruennichi]
MEDIFPPDYNKQASPNIPGKPVSLFIDLSVMDIDRIDESSMEFSIQTYMREIWNDRRLNLSCFKTVDALAQIGIPDSVVRELWTPDIIFDNVRSGVLFSLSVRNQFISVLRNGDLYRATRYNFIVGCYMNFIYYPIDIQECYLKISLLSNPDRKVLLQWAREDEHYKNYFKGVSFTNEIQSLKYELRPPKTYKTIAVSAGENFTYLYANFTFVRKISGSILNVYIPSTLVVCLSWTSFWIDVGVVPARITLGVTSFLTLVTQMVQARNSLPAISYMTAMDLWLFVCLVKVFCSILVYAFTYRLYMSSNKVFDIS